MLNRITNLKNPHGEKKSAIMASIDSKAEKLTSQVMKQEGIAVGDRSSHGHMITNHSQLCPENALKKLR